MHGEMCIRDRDSMNRKIVVGCGLLLVAGILTVGIWAISRVPPVYQPPKPAPLPRVVEHYENQLDPEIPKITVTAIQDDEAFKLPYDAVLIDGSAEPDDPEGPKDWFLNLMNNFWSLPELCHDFLPGRNPVSYTHLDVYKRQQLNGMFGFPLFPALCRNGIAQFDKSLTQYFLGGTNGDKGIWINVMHGLFQ